MKDIETSKNNKKDDIKQYISDVKKENEEFDMKLENIRLKELIEIVKKENEKIPKAKSLLEEYKNTLKQKDAEISNLKQSIQQLYKSLQKIPKFIRKIFLKDENRLSLK